MNTDGNGVAGIPPPHRLLPIEENDGLRRIGVRLCLSVFICGRMALPQEIPMQKLHWPRLRQSFHDASHAVKNAVVTEDRP